MRDPRNNIFCGSFFVLILGQGKLTGIAFIPTFAFMRIAIDARFIFSNEMPGYSAFTKEVFINLAAKHPADEFIFLVDQPLVNSENFPPNSITVLVTPKPKNYISYKWWFDVKLPMALRKHKPDIFIGTYGLCSNNTGVPQLLIVHDLGFLHHQAAHFPHSALFYKNSTANCLKKSGGIIATSEAIKTELFDYYKKLTTDVNVCKSAVNSSIEPLEWDEKNKVKATYTEGCEYFIFNDYKQSLLPIYQCLKSIFHFQKMAAKQYETGNYRLFLFYKKGT